MQQQQLTFAGSGRYFPIFFPLRQKIFHCVTQVVARCFPLHHAKYVIYKGGGRGVCPPEALFLGFCCDGIELPNHGEFNGHKVRDRRPLGIPHKPPQRANTNVANPKVGGLFDMRPRTSLLHFQPSRRYTCR